MKIFKIVIVVLGLLFISCSSYKSLNMFNIQTGMSKQEVITALGKKPDNLIGSKRYVDGIIDVIQYSKYSIIDNSLEERYYLYFWNDELVQWGRAGDWQKEADYIYEIRNR